MEVGRRASAQGSRAGLGDRVLVSLGSLILAALVFILGKTGRLRWVGREGLEEVADEGERYVLAFWHEHALLMRYGSLKRPITVLVSLHKDGEIAARALRRLGVDTSRGSSSRRGAMGLRELVKKVREGYDAGFAIDGPRGPRRKVQPGVLQAARLTGAPIIPVAFASLPSRRLRSWDQMLVPFPFSRGVYLYGGSLRVPREASREELEDARRRLEEEMRSLTDRAEALVREG
jgi:lysophospholipid acyltransferase (LPLAT)-like uncharacterized protein